MECLEKTINIDGINLCYCEYGEGRPIFFIYGIPGAKDNFKLIIENFVNNGFKCIVPERKSIEYFDKNVNFLDIYKKLIETLFNEKIYLIGYSIGAFFALKLAMACENKFTGLSLVSPFLFIDVKVHKKSNLPKIFKSRFMKFLFNIFFIHIYRMFLIARLKKSFYPEKIPKEKQEDALKKYGNLEYLLSTIVDINFFIKNTLNEEEFKKIKLKVLSICCKDDKICDSIAFSNKVKEYKNDLEISIIENGGHGLIFTHPEEMFGLISNHITRISTD